MKTIERVNRRTVLKGLAAGLVSTGVPSEAQAHYREWHWDGHIRIWDVHSHFEAVRGDTPEARMEVLVRHMDRLGLERLILSQGSGEYISHPTPQQVREENDRIMRAVRYFPDRAYGAVFLSPADVDFSLQEFDRCVRCTSPKLAPIVERAISMNVPILQHTWLKTQGNEPGESTPFDLVELAKRHPEGKFICGHTGGTWELGIRAIRDTKNIYAEIAGSDPTSGFTEMAVRELGAERVIYGSDVGGRTFASQMAKVIGADIPDSAKELILGGNLRRLLQPSLKAKGYAS